MFEVLRFGVAWMAILLLAGITSVPPGADEPSCCQTPVERDSMSFRHWISHHFKEYAPSFSPLVDDTEQVYGKQSGLCSKTESGSWARIVGDREPRPNGLLLSIFCETRHHTMWIIKYISGAHSWKEAREALAIMTEEVVTGCLWTLSELTKLSITVLGTGMEVTKEHLPTPWVEQLSRFSANVENMDAADVGLYSVDFIATYLLELTITDVVSFVRSLREPAIEMTLGCCNILSDAVGNMADTWERFIEFVEDHSGQPLFHSGYGIFTLIPTLLSIFFECSKTVATQLLEVISNVDYGEHYARLCEITSKSLESGVLNVLARLMSYILRETCRLYSTVMCAACLGCSSLLGYNTLTKITESFSNVWTSYLKSDSMHFISECLQRLCETFCEVIMTSVPVVVDVFAKANHFVIFPAFDMLSQALFSFGLSLEVPSLDEITQYLQFLAMIVLQGLIAVSKGSLLMTQKIGGIREAGHIDTVDNGGLLLHWPAVYRLIGLVALGGLVMLVGMFYKFLKVSERYRQWHVAPGRLVCVGVNPDQEAESATEASLDTAERRENINQAIKLIADEFTAVERMKSDSHYHHFLMEEKQSKTSVYLKCLRIKASRKARIRLVKECRTTRKLQHAHIVGFVKWIRVGNIRALALEYTSHGHLRSAMATPGAPFKLSEKMSVFRQILTAVIFLHNEMAAHLNIRPGSVLVFNKWKRVKLSGFSHVIKVSPDGMCQEYDLHHVAGPMEALVRMRPYNPYKADTWALGSLLFYIITGDFLHGKTNTPVPAILLPALNECDMRYQKIILTTLTSLLFYEPKHRPELVDVLQTIDNLEK